MLEETKTIEQRNDYLTQRTPVEVYHNNETGEWLWSVQVVGTEFWVDSFRHEHDAIQFCVSHSLPYALAGDTP